MKKRKLREGLEFQLARAEAFQDMLVERIAERNRARSAARLWKRAARKYRQEAESHAASSVAAGKEIVRIDRILHDAANPMIAVAALAERDKMREERDAARAELARWRTTAEEWEGKLREERDAAMLQRERDAAKLVGYLDEFRAEMAAMSAMPPREGVAGAPERVWCAPYWENGEHHWEGGRWRDDARQEWYCMGETGADEPVIRYLRADIVDARIRSALEAAAERAVEWFDTLGPISPD